MGCTAIIFNLALPCPEINVRAVVHANIYTGMWVTFWSVRPEV